MRLAADAPGDPLAAAARIPTSAWRAAHDALPHGAVLVQVPHAGYLPGVACATCRAPARCPACAGPLRLQDAVAATGPICGWCGRVWPAWTCPHCQGRRLRATRTGVERTAEELGRAFPGAAVVVSRADRDLPAVPATGALVLATPGIEPFAPGGYAAALLLDGDALLARPDLRAGEEALRRWRNAAALVRPAEEAGVVVLAADPSAPAVQALVRGDPAGYAARELAERRELRLPPGAAVASVTGDPAAVTDFVAALDLPAGTSVLGPVPMPQPPGRREAAGAVAQTRMLLQAEPARSGGSHLGAAECSGRPERPPRRGRRPGPDRPARHRLTPRPGDHARCGDLAGGRPSAVANRRHAAES